MRRLPPVCVSAVFFLGDDVAGLPGPLSYRLIETEADKRRRGEEAAVVVVGWGQGFPALPCPGRTSAPPAV